MKEPACINCQSWIQDNKRDGRCKKRHHKIGAFNICVRHRRCSREEEKERFERAGEEDDNP